MYSIKNRESPIHISGSIYMCVCVSVCVCYKPPKELRNECCSAARLSAIGFFSSLFPFFFTKNEGVWWRNSPLYYFDENLPLVFSFLFPIFIYFSISLM